MGMLALISTGSHEAIVSIFPDTAPRIDLPGIGQLSPPEADWQGSGYRIADIEPAEIPAGKQLVSAGIDGVGLIDGVPTWDLEDTPPVPIPDRVTSRQFFLQLEAAGLLDQVEAWVETQPMPIQIAFERSGTFARDDGMLQQGFSALGFTAEQIDQFFAAAGTR